MKTHVAVIDAYGSAGVVVAERLADESDVELTLVDDGDPAGGLGIVTPRRGRGGEDDAVGRRDGTRRPGDSEPGVSPDDTGETRRAARRCGGGRRRVSRAVRGRSIRGGAARRPRAEPNAF